MAVKERIIIYRHADYKWIMGRIGGHGGSYSYNAGNPESLARIGYIGSTSRVVIWFYNFQLFIRYCKRKLKKRRGG